MFPTPKVKNMSLVHPSINRWHVNNDEMDGDKEVLGPNDMGTRIAIIRKSTCWAYRCEKGAIVVA